MKKSILIFTYLLLNVSPRYNDYIIIEHVGDNDKPIITIQILKKTDVISDKEQQFDYKSFFLSKRKFKNVVNAVKGNAKSKSSSSAEFGSFKVEIRCHNITNEYIFGRNESINLFRQIEGVFNENKEDIPLKSAIQTNLKRINYQ